MHFLQKYFLYIPLFISNKLNAVNTIQVDHWFAFATEKRILFIDFLFFEKNAILCT